MNLQHKLAPVCSCAQPQSGPCAPLPVCSSIVRGHRKELRFRSYPHFRTLNLDFYTNLSRNSFQSYNGFACELSEGRVARNPARNREIRVKSSPGMSSECSSTSERVSRSLRWRTFSPSSGAAGEAEENEEVLARSTGWRAASMHALGALLLGTLLFNVSPADAADALKTCACLLKECRVELARCIADPGCAANVACLNTCNDRPDETECQIKCGDLFENSVVDQFNDCAVSRKGCVPQKKDEGLFPIPPPTALVQKFDIKEFTGTWYITSGLNKTFDTFDCQVHQFNPSPPSQLTANLAWRIPTPDGGFFTRKAVQNFVQDKSQPGILFNHGNEFLHYQDDWYILASKIEKSPDDYIFVYYRGSNDAWDGYGGAVVYTRSRTLPPSIVPELASAAKTVGLDFNKFTTTDNTCGPEAPLLARLEKKVEEEEQFIAEEVKEEEQSLVRGVTEVINRVGKAFVDILNGETDLINKSAAELKREEEIFLKSLGDEEKALLDELQMEAKDIEQLFGRAIPIRKFR